MTDLVERIASVIRLHEGCSEEGLATAIVADLGLHREDSRIRVHRYVGTWLTNEE